MRHLIVVIACLFTVSCKSGGTPCDDEVAELKRRMLKSPSQTKTTSIGIFHVISVEYLDGMLRGEVWNFSYTRDDRPGGDKNPLVNNECRVSQTVVK